MKLILLGTGAPPPTVEKNGPSNAIVSDGKLFLIDAGRNVATQSVRAGFPVASIDNIVFTHFHSDHYTGFGEFFISRWIMGAKNILKVFGPPPIIEIVERMLLYYEYDIELRVNEGKPRDGTEIDVTVISPGDVFSINGVEISAVKGTNHGNVEDILSYKFLKNDRRCSYIF